MSSPWDDFKQQHAERWNVLHDGLPKWIHEQVINWFTAVYKPWKVDYLGVKRYPSTRYILVNIEGNKYVSLYNDFGIDKSDVVGSVRQLIRSEDQKPLLIFLDLTIQYIRSQDEVLFLGEETESKVLLRYLDDILEKGSKWSVVYDKKSDVGLIERTNGQILSLAKKLNIDPLTKAWNEAFSLKPNPEAAIEHAQKALESVASDAGLTKATTKIYNALLGDIKANPAKYVSSAYEAYKLHDNLAKRPLGINEEFAIWFATGMDLIQKTHPARHPSSLTKDFNLGPEAAKQAVLMATILCNLVANRHFEKV